ncbi:MAG: RICIN domain-containing protein [Spirosomataceae bacterium]
MKKKHQQIIYIAQILVLLLCNSISLFSQELPFSDMSYYIQNVATGKMIFMSNDMEKGTKVVTSEASHHFNNQVVISLIEGSTTDYNFSSSLGESLYFAVQGNAWENQNGTPLQVWDSDVANYARFKLQPTGQPRTFVIRSSLSNMPIGADGLYSDKIHQWWVDPLFDTRFQWRIIPVVSDGFYMLKNKATGQVLDVQGFDVRNGSVLTQYGTYNETTNQIFEITGFGGEQADQFLVSPTHSKGTKFLESPKSDGSQLQIWESSGDDSHLKWQIRDVSGDYDQQYVRLQSSESKIFGIHNPWDNRVVGFHVNSVNPNEDRFQWELVPVEPVNYLPEGRYVISNKATQKVWDVSGANLAPGTLIQEYPYYGQANQEFDITINDRGQYNFSPVHSLGTSYVFVKGDNNNWGDPLHINSKNILAHPASEFEIYPLTEDGDTFGIRSTFSKMDIGVHANPGTVDVMQYNMDVKNDARFQWIFEALPQLEYVEPAQYVIQNVATGKVLDVAGWGTALGTKVNQWWYGGGANQKFDLKPSGLGYTIGPMHTSGKFLNVCGCQNFNGFGISIWTPYMEVEKFKIDLITYENNGNPIFGIKSLYSNLSVGVHDANNPTVIQHDVFWGVENDARFQWRFIKINSPRAREMALESPSTEVSVAIQPEIEIYPNPVVDDFGVKLSEFSEQEDLTITIADAMGNVILQKNIGKERELNFNSASLGLKELNYVINVSNGVDKKVSKILKRE